MLEQTIEHRIKFYEKDISNPYSVNGFSGTWAISHHAGIPEVLRGYLQRHFGILRLSRVKIDEINDALNDIWEGPGSLAKVFAKELEYKQSGKDIKIMASDLSKKTFEEDEVKVDTE